MASSYQDVSNQSWHLEGNKLNISAVSPPFPTISTSLSTQQSVILKYQLYLLKSTAMMEGKYAALPSCKYCPPASLAEDGKQNQSCCDIACIDVAAQRECDAEGDDASLEEETKGMLIFQCSCQLLTRNRTLQLCRWLLL